MHKETFEADFLHLFSSYSSWYTACLYTGQDLSVVIKMAPRGFD
jgi:hypothetical protein